MADQTPDPIATQPAEERPSPLKNPRVRLILIIVIAGALIGGIAWFIRYESFGKFQQSTNDAYVQADAVTVSPKISGYVDKVFVADNQAVKAGEPLLRIDPRDYDAQAAQSRAQIDVAKANAAGVQAQISEQQAAIVRARADLAAARTAAAFAHSEAARYQPLAASGAETRERLSQLRNDAVQADAKVAAAGAALVSAERRVGTLLAQVKQALAQGEGARAQLAAANTNVGATLIRAAIDGRVGNKTVRQGQFVQAATRLMTLVPVRDLYIDANFKETQLGLVRVGQPVSVRVDALPGVEIPGRVASVSPGTGAQFSVLPPQNATGNFTKIVQRVPVRIALDAKELAANPLRVGLSVNATVDTADKSGARLARGAAVPYRGDVAVDGNDPAVEARIRQIIAANR